MKKGIVLLLLIACLVPAAVPQALAAEEASKTGVVEGGNRFCPVSGDPVSGSDFVIYKGVRYGLCCPACKGPFLLNSAKYIAQMKTQEAKPIPTATVTPVIPESEAMEKKMDQSNL